MRTCYYKGALLALMTSIASMSFAGSSDVENKADISGWFWLTAGRFESITDILSETTTPELNGTFWEDIHVGMKLQLYPRANTRLTLHAGAAFQQPSSAGVTASVLVGRTLSMYLVEASARHSFSDSSFMPMYVDFGYFPVWYNKNSRNFGEYLVRSGAYPPSIISGFEINDKVKAVGLRYGVEPLQGLQVETMLTSELTMFPFHDLSLTALANYRPMPLFSVGAGWMGSRIISIDSTKTTPGTDKKKFDLTLRSDLNRVGVVDPATNDTVLLSHTGHKFQFNFELNPRTLLETPLLGQNDLKVYGEVGLLGLKKYPVWYTKRAERMPMMVGLNFPTQPLMSGGIMTALALFADANNLDSEKVMLPHPDRMWKSGIWTLLGAGSWALNKFLGLDTWLDVLALEVEYYENPYINSWRGVTMNRSPVPVDVLGPPTYPEFYKRHHNDDWKWSIYAAKKIGKSMTLSGQIANDNANRTAYGDTYSSPLNMKPKNWYWMMRAKFAF